MANKYNYALPAGHVLHGANREYVIEQTLGKGGFAITYKVKAPIVINDTLYEPYIAVKEFFPNICSRSSDKETMAAPEAMHDEINNGLKDFINEGKRLMEVCALSPNIVNVNEVFEANGTAYYVLEYLEGGNLRRMVHNNGGRGLTEQQMLEIMIPVGHAVQCLHANRVLHLDIKPDNILMRRNHHDGSEVPVLIDFGIAVHFSNDGTPTSKTPSQGVSPGYSPIEQYAIVKQFDPRLDVYAFSATCLFLLTGKDPVEALNMPSGYVRSMLPANVSENVARAIERGMSRDRGQRIDSIDDMLAYFVGMHTEEPVNETKLRIPDIPIPNNQAYNPVPNNQTHISQASNNQPYYNQAQAYNNQAPKNKKNKGFPWLIVLIIALVVALGVGAYFAFGPNFSKKKSSSHSEESSTSTELVESEDNTDHDVSYEGDNGGGYVVDDDGNYGGNNGGGYNKYDDSYNNYDNGGYVDNDGGGSYNNYDGGDNYGGGYDDEVSYDNGY